MLALPKVNYAYLAPELLLTFLALMVLVVDLYWARGKTKLLGWLSVLSLLAVGGVTLTLVGVSGTTLSNALVVDPFAIYFKLIFLGTGILIAVVSMDYIARNNLPSSGEFYALLLFATIGMMFMAASTDLIMIFIGLELTSITSYILAGYRKTDPKSNESILKYFILGLIATAIMLYGLTFIYGFTGQTELGAIADVLRGKSASLAVIAGVMFAIAGFAFKVASVPFHQWVPDVYEGAPTPITAFLAVGPKVAAFAALARILFIGFPDFVSYWKVIFIILAIASMFIGNLMAIPQKNIKRMLAYSSIAHAGYIMVGFAVASSLAIEGILIYTVAYAMMSLGAFTVIMAVSSRKGGGEELSDFNGLAKRSSFLAVSMAVFMVSLTGLPPTAGFFGKLWIFKAAVDKGLWWLALIGFINSAISLYYYINVIRHMYLLEPDSDTEIASTPAFSGAIWITMVGVLTLVIWLNPLAMASHTAAQVFGGLG
jgi:NADH-quinone oxidoreductase subunit N